MAGLERSPVGGASAVAVLVADLRQNRVAQLVAQTFQALNAWVGYHHPYRSKPDVNRCYTEMQQALDDYFECRTNQERYLWLAWAFNIQHRRGSVIKDWWDWAELPGVNGDHMWRLIDQAQQHGPATIFDEDELAAFLEADECPVHLFLTDGSEDEDDDA